MRNKKENNTNLKLNMVIMSLLLVVAVFCTNTGFVEAAASPSTTAASYAAVFDATYYSDHYADLKAAFGNNEQSLFQHFLNSGMKEGRQASEEFNVQAYKARYSDLRSAYGENLVLYYQHYIVCGKAEGRNGRADGVTNNSASGQTVASNQTQPNTVSVPLGTEKVIAGTTYVVKGHTSQGVALYAAKGDSKVSFEICPYALNYVEAIGLTNSMTDKEKADAIAMYLATLIHYNYSYQSSWAPLKTRSGVCDDYTRDFRAICRLVGIEAYYIASDEMNHAWNSVIIGGVEYYYDVTWVSCRIDKGYQANSYYKWFGTTSDVFYSDGTHVTYNLIRDDRTSYNYDIYNDVFDRQYSRSYGGQHRCVYTSESIY